MPPRHTHLGTRFFEIEYIKIIQDSFSLMLSCRNVTLRSHIRVGTWHSDPLIRVGTWHSDHLIRVRTWHSDPILPCRNVTLWSIYLIILFHQVFFMSRCHLNREDLRLKVQQSYYSNQPQLHNQNIQSHNQVHRRLYNTTQYISITI